MDALEVYEKKTKLVKKMLELGVEGIHSEMSMEEMKKLYIDWKNKQKEKEIDDSKISTVKAHRLKCEMKKRVHISNGVMVMPEDFREIHEDEIDRERVEGDELIVFFKQGAKVRYNMRTFKRVI